jgi:Uma2 family endonuclease
MDNAAGNSGNLPTLPRVEPLSGEIIPRAFWAECLKLRKISDSMEIETKFPLTRAELADISTGLVRFPASWEEFWDVLEHAEYRTDFLQNEIITMSYESNLHSTIATELMWLLRNLFPRPQFIVHDSNRPVYLQDCENSKAIFNPDCSVTPEPPQLFTYKPGMDAETNPLLVVEILSKSTREYDLAEKLPCYKKMPGLRYIIYVDSMRTYITLFQRTGSDQWLNTDYDQLDSAFEIEGKTILLREVYSHLGK